MTRAIATSRSGLDLLDDLLSSDEVWIERAGEARLIAHQIRAAASSLIVLYGARASGNTELIRRWVIPDLAGDWQVVYHGLNDVATPPAPAGKPTIEIWDGCEAEIVRDRDGSPFLQRLAGTRSADPAMHKTVMVIQEDFLSRLFQLRQAVPNILESVYEIPGMSVPDFMDALTRATSGRGVPLPEGLLAAISADVESLRRERALAPELVAVLGFELIRSHALDDTATMEGLRARGGITGILEAHLDVLFENLPDGIDPQIGWAVLNEVLATGPGQFVDLADVARRFDIDESAPARVVRWLVDERRVLRPGREGGHEIVPAQLAAAATARAQREDEAVEPLRRLLGQGIRHFAEADALPPERSFRKVHARRSALKVGSEEAKLMLRCALAYEDSTSGGATEHWLRRVPDPAERAEILLDSLFDARAEVRQRAAGRLRDFDLPEVRQQLHLLALRDEADAVREAAIDSLGVIRDQERELSLVQEINDPNSPYRIEAIRALRAFPDPIALEGLVQIVRSTDPVHDIVLRAAAIESLARQESAASLQALLSIALDDEDGEDRTAAARALALVRRRESAVLVLDAIRNAASSRPAPLPRSFRRIAVGVLSFLGSVATVLLNVALHGFALITMRRFRLGLSLLAVEAALAVAFRPELEAAARGDLRATPGVVLLIATMFAGYAVPMAILLRERRDGIRLTTYRRMLGGVLFAAGAGSVFLAVHGLPSLLINLVWRGLALIAFQAAAVALIVAAPHLLDVAALWPSYTGTITALFAPVAAQLIVPTAIAVLLFTYVDGVGLVAWRAFAWRSRRERCRRVDLVYRHLLENPEVSAIVLERFCGDNAREAKWGESVVRNHRGAIRERLCRLWDDAGPESRRRIVRALASRPDGASIDFLKETAGTIGWTGQLRWMVAVWRFRLSVWPMPLLLGICLGLWVLALYGTVLHDAGFRNPIRHLSTLQNPNVNVEERVNAARYLGDVAGSTNDWQAASIAVAVLTAGLSPGEYQWPPALMNAVLTALPAGSSLQQTEQMIGSILESATDPTTSSSALSALRRIASPQSVDVLRAFIERTADRGRDKAIPWSEPDEAAIDSIVAALGTLRDMSGDSTAALRSLQALGESPTLPDGVRTRVKAVVEQVEPLRWSEYYLEAADYEAAVAAADAARYGSVSSEQFPSDEQYARMGDTLGKALVLRGLAASASQQPDFQAAARDLAAALNSGARPASLVDAVPLALQLGFHYHETPTAPQSTAFEQTYQVLNSVLPLAHGLGVEATVNVETNLAEAALTTGRYDEAERLAGDAEQWLRTRPDLADEDVVCAIKFVKLAVYAIRNDVPRRDLALKDFTAYRDSLGAGFKTTWTYDGTRRYLMSSAGLSASNRALLQKTLDRLNL